MEQEGAEKMDERLAPCDMDSVAYDTWELCGLDHVCKRDCRKPTPCKIPTMVRKLFEYEKLGTVEELAALKERMRWIPVSERLPDSEADVLAITKQFGIAVSRYHRSLNYPQLDSGWFCHSQRVSVTHWMSLPEAPKEADHADS